MNQHEGHFKSSKWKFAEYGFYPVCVLFVCARFAFIMEEKDFHLFNVGINGGFTMIVDEHALSVN